MQILNFNNFKNKHTGEKCFILGSAPSLKMEDLSLLKDEYVFLTNRSYLAARELNLSNYHYYVLTDLRNYVYDYAEIKSLVTGVRFYPAGITTLNEYNQLPIEDFVPINKYGDTKKRKMLIKALETLLHLDKNLKMRGITFKNLSKGFAFKDSMDTDTLENVLRDKLHT
jgi:hypothetical protein